MAGAGPLPAVGNLILHLMYGAALGLVYGPLGDVLMEEPADAGQRDLEVVSMHRAEGSAARGILIGVAVGGGIGLLGLLVGTGWHVSLILGLSPGWFMLSAATVGAALGALVGAIMGLPTQTADVRGG